VTGVFISYRREDAAGWAGRLQEALRRELPENEVFYDIGAIGLGEDFVEAMRRSLESCTVAIVMIGPHWLDARDEAGNRRLDDPEDWVRLEVVESLQRQGLRVVPVLVGSASMPRAAELPEPLKPLARRNAHEITDKRWEYDVTQLVAALKKIPLVGVPSRPVSAESQPLPAARSRAEARLAVRPAELRPGTVFRDGDDGPEMVVIPAGEFVMGSPESEEGRLPDEGPPHKVTLARPFAVGKYAVTFDEWDACVAAGGCAHTPGDRRWGRGRQPVIGVSWDDVQAYVSWLAKKTGQPYRLLSEAEWEYAARAGTTTRFPWGDEPGTNRANFDGSGSRWSKQQTAPVGSFDANAFDLHDMIGNVWEWVQDCWNGSYEGAPGNGRAWESGDCIRRVLRGGSWHNVPELARAAGRVGNMPGTRSGDVGFRLARTL
jgi:formylglycine-generating enzyme required for sulfatase activity